MMTRRVSLQNDIISIMVPVTLRRHGGRKHIVAPDGTAIAPKTRQPASALLISLAKAKYWQMQIDNGKYRNAEHLAKARKISSSYVFRLLRLNQLSPDIKLAILDGRQPVTMDAECLRLPFPDLWHQQLRHFGFTSQKQTGA